MGKKAPTWDESESESESESETDNRHDVGAVAGAVVSSGVFTHGHVGGEALAELVRITASGGLVSLTRRLDIEARLRRHVAALTEAGSWQLVEQTPPHALHPDRDETLQVITTWRVR